MKFISLGAACGTATFIQYIGKKEANCPFDWCVSSLQFVFEIIKLIVKDISSEEIARHHFFKKSFSQDGHGTFKTADNGPLAHCELYAAFLHEDKKTFIQTVQAYDRRIERLRSIIKSNEHVTYVWAPPGGIHTFDGNLLVHDVAEALNGIYSVLIQHNPNAKMLVFNDHALEGIDSRIEYIEVDPSGDHLGISSGIHAKYKEINSLPN